MAARVTVQAILVVSRPFSEKARGAGSALDDHGVFYAHLRRRRKVPDLTGKELANVHAFSHHIVFPSAHFTHLHHRASGPARHDDSLGLFERDSPHGICGCGKLTRQQSRVEVPHFDPTVTSAADDPGAVELKAGDAVVVSREPMDGRVSGQRPDANGTVGATGDQRVTPHLQLPDQGRVALQNGIADTGVRVPYPYAGVQTSRRDAFPVECDRVDLAEMARQSTLAAPFGNTPDAGRRVVTPRDDQITVDGETSHTGLVADQDILARARGQIPYPQRRVSRTGNRRVPIRHLQTTHSRRVTAQQMDTSPAHGDRISTSPCELLFRIRG